MKQNKKQTESVSKIDTGLSYVALIILAGLAYEGILSVIDAKPSVQIGTAIILIGLLVKTALKK